MWVGSFAAFKVINSSNSGIEWGVSILEVYRNLCEALVPCRRDQCLLDICHIEAVYQGETELSMDCHILHPDHLDHTSCGEAQHFAWHALQHVILLSTYP